MGAAIKVSRPKLINSVWKTEVLEGWECCSGAGEHFIIIAIFYELKT
jgi:hypothetical protein